MLCKYYVKKESRKHVCIFMQTSQINVFFNPSLWSVSCEIVTIFAIHVNKKTQKQL